MEANRKATNEAGVRILRLLKPLGLQIDFMAPDQRTQKLFVKLGKPMIN
jgi:hypothetical protein